jgi:hypothetical protein
MIELPNWTPEFVRPLLGELDRNPACIGERRVALDRLANDKRMRSVYDEFLRHDRKSDKFLYPAKIRKRDQLDDAAQLTALREVLCVVMSAAGDRMSVSKLEQLRDAKRRWGDLAVQLRGLAHDIGMAMESGLLGFNDPQSKTLGARDVIALYHIANWLDHQTTALRRPGDPLIVKRHRGDPRPTLAHYSEFLGDERISSS